MGDDLLNQIKGLRERENAREFETEKKAYKSRMNQMKEDIGIFRRYLYQFGWGLYWVWINILNPIRGVLASIGGALFGWYRRLWSLFVYKRDPYGDLVFSKKYAGLFIVATFTAFYSAYMVAGFAFDATLYATTHKTDEVIYLTNSQEIDPENNIHSVQGCTSLPCDDESSIYFRIDPTPFNHVWSLISNHNVFYPDYISAAVPPGVNRCTVSSYGVRLKLMMRGLDIYPYILRASCLPVTDKPKE